MILSASLLLASSEFPSSSSLLVPEFKHKSSISKSTQTSAQEQNKDPKSTNRQPQKINIKLVHSFAEVKAYNEQHKLVTAKKLNKLIKHEQLQNFANNIQATKVLIFKNADGNYFYFFFKE